MALEVFNRIEKKYLISQQNKDLLLNLLDNFMDKDSYNKNGKTYSICNLYLDTPSNELIIRSLEKPVFKEKIRLRSYGTAQLNDTVYLESKKKYKGIVNKRRTPCTLEAAYNYFETGILQDNSKIINPQVFSEIDYIIKYYNLTPKVFISYDRIAFFEKNNSDFRITIDSNILSRRKDLKLDIPASGEPLLPPDTFLMEAKAYNTFPLWFARFLSEQKIFSTSFSKYGREFNKYCLSGDSE
ncbi:MAG: polyphosphate polymerase domain-containing protein [Treponema sp.]|nr:polyphosphate polymerase domain-containing protein [Treponema sp.]